MDTVMTAQDIAPKSRKAKRQTSSTPKMPANVQAVFDTYPTAVRRRFTQVRALLFQMAAQYKEVGPITETLKWGEPAYLTEQSKSGSTIRFQLEGRAAGPLGSLLQLPVQIDWTLQGALSASVRL